MFLYWRFVITAIASAIIMALQGTQINIDVLAEYMLKDAEPSNWSFTFLSPTIFSVNKDGQRTVSHVRRFLMLHVPYYGCLFVILVLCNKTLWKCRPSRWFLLISMGILAICSGTAPFSIKKPRLMYLDRTLQGGGSALIHPLVFDHLVLWIPPKERGTVCGLVYGGIPLSMALTIWFTDVICRLIKWEYIFYIELPCIILAGLSVYLVSPTPELHRFISDEERNYIVGQFGGRADTREKRRPLQLITLVSWVPYLATLYASFCLFWGWNVILFVLPLYLEHIHGIKVLETPMLTALPFLLSWAVSVVFGIVLDVLVKEKFVSGTVARRFCVLISAVVPLVCLLVLNTVGSIPAVCLVWTIILSWGAGVVGIFSNFMDIAPNFGGVIMLFVVFNMILSFFFVFILFYLLLDYKSLKSYWIIFSLTAGLYASEACVCFCISAKEAYWNSIL